MAELLLIEALFEKTATRNKAEHSCTMPGIVASTFARFFAGYLDRMGEAAT